MDPLVVVVFLRWYGWRFARTFVYNSCFELSTPCSADVTKTCSIDALLDRMYVRVYDMCPTRCMRTLCYRFQVLDGLWCAEVNMRLTDPVLYLGPWIELQKDPACMTRALARRALPVSMKLPVAQHSVIRYYNHVVATRASSD